MIHLLAAIALAASSAPARAELKADPGGWIRFDYGVPRWQEAWERQIGPGLSWRISASSPNTLRTDAALIFDDTVVFPGEYNLGAVCRGEPEWDLVFHHYGLHYEGGTHAGMTRTEVERLEGTAVREELEVSFLESQGGYLLRIDFGTRRLEKPFRTARVKTARGRAGAHAFTSAWLERSDVEAMDRLLREDQLTVARIESPDLRDPLRVHLRFDEELEVVLESENPIRADRFLEGRHQAVPGAKKPFSHAIRSGREAAELSFQIGEAAYSFDLPATLFDSAETGEDDGNTGKQAK